MSPNRIVVFEPKSCSRACTPLQWTFCAVFPLRVALSNFRSPAGTHPQTSPSPSHPHPNPDPKPSPCRFRYAGHRVVQILIASKIGLLLSHVASLSESDMQRSQTAQTASRKKAVEGLVLAINAFSTSEKSAVFPPQAPLLQGQGNAGGGSSLQSAPNLNRSSTARSETHTDGTTAIRCGSGR